MCTDQLVELEEWIITGDKVIDYQPIKPDIELNWEKLDEQKISKTPIL